MVLGPWFLVLGTKNWKCRNLEIQESKNMESRKLEKSIVSIKIRPVQNAFRVVLSRKNPPAFLGLFVACFSPWTGNTFFYFS